MTVNIKGKSIKVVCLETGKEFASGKDAAKEMGICQSMVSRSARNIKPTNGFNFRFVDEDGNVINTPSEPKFKKNKANEIQLEIEQISETENPIVVIHNESTVTAEKGNHVNGNSKAVCCLETGEVYPSVLDMAKAHGISYAYMSKCCNNGSTCNGKHYFFVKSASEKVEDIVTYIRSLQNIAYDPEYLAWKRAKEAAEAEERRKKAEQEAFERRKAELEDKIIKQGDKVKAASIKLAHEREILEAIIAELDKFMTTVKE